MKLRSPVPLLSLLCAALLPLTLAADDPKPELHHTLFDNLPSKIFYFDDTTVSNTSLSLSGAHKAGRTGRGVPRERGGELKPQGRVTWARVRRRARPPTADSAVLGYPLRGTMRLWTAGRERGNMSPVRNDGARGAGRGEAGSVHAGGGRGASQLSLPLLPGSCPALVLLRELVPCAESDQPRDARGTKAGTSLLSLASGQQDGHVRGRAFFVAPGRFPPQPCSARGHYEPLLRSTYASGTWQRSTSSLYRRTTARIQLLE